MASDISAGQLTPHNALGKNTATLTIENGAADSNAIDLNGATFAGFQTPAALTQTTMRFKVSADGVTYGLLYKDDNTLYSITVPTGAVQNYAVNLALFKPWRFVKISMGGNEGAARSIPITYTGV